MGRNSTQISTYPQHAAMNFSNRNTLWASMFVEELAHQGLTTVCIAPGSRSTPLTLAFSEHPDIDVYLHHDERCASFFALGAALASERPVVLVCTSGTALANFYPAIIEAYQSQVPLLILTTDRPHDQRDSGANQTINQVGLYDNHTLWSVDVAPPEADPSDRTLRYLRTLAGRAFSTANGMRKGPIHLNFPFKKPLEPTEVVSDQPSESTLKGLGFGGRDKAFVQFERGTLTPTSEQIDQLINTISHNRKGIIVCGPRSPKDTFPQALIQLADKIGYPILADSLSGLRYGPHASDLVLGGYETFLRNFSKQPDVVLRFGAMPTSKHLGQKLATWSDSTQITISDDGQWQDPVYGSSQTLWADPTMVCEALTENLEVEKDQDWISQWIQTEAVCRKNILIELDQTWMEETVVSDVVEALPNLAALYIANSLSVRHLDQFALPNSKKLMMFGNRGVSGIDGTISSAAGAASKIDQPMVLITGDLAFYHDLNGLLALKQYGIKLIIVLINNDGGNIFRRLPIAKHEPPFNELFLTSHGLTFESAASLYSLNYSNPSDRDEFQAAFQQALIEKNSHIIEVMFDGEQNHQHYQELVKKILNKLSAR
jgi:2-succinyl-5-enolpyruvyl-6-hydroxy-3-cyclohexene-1-carboxylate synthase